MSRDCDVSIFLDNVIENCKLSGEPSGPVAFFCTDTPAAGADILTTVADRYSLETAFRDCKEVVGAGQQQVRFVWANVGAIRV